MPARPILPPAPVVNGGFRTVALAAVLWIAAAGGCSRPVAPAPATPPPANDVASAKTAEATHAVRDLEREFAGEADEARRIEIIYEIALQPAPAAPGALRAIWSGTTDEEIREHVVRALPFAFGAGAEETLALFRDAVAADEPAELRAAAADALRDIESPATLPLWKTLEHDPDAEVQETARAALEYLAEKFPVR